jgi:glycosyltransferase involved in cell wall biosynthesis
MAEGLRSMKLSVITPSFNQAQFLPVNLASLNAQTYYSVEHIVVDPGSTDGSTAIAKKDPSAILIVEPDRGQSDGICKGFSRSTGDVLAWLNSDDFYPNDQVLESVACCFHENPEIDIVYGDVNFVDEQGNFLRKGFVNKSADQLLDSFEYQVGIVQPGVFWRRRVFEEIGGPSEEFEYCMDYELWVRMASKGYKWKYLPQILANHRWWGGMKTSSRRDLSLNEHFKVCDRYFGYVHWRWLDRYADYLCSNQDGVVNHASDIDSFAKTNAIRRAIDEVVTQEMMATLAMSKTKELVETQQYIESHYPEKKRIYFNHSELAIISEFAADPKAQQRIAWNIFDAVSEDQELFVAYHVPENFDRYFSKEWHTAQLERSNSAMQRLSAERRSDVCVVVGNGPSLRKSDLTLLANVDTIISNFAGLSKDLSRYAKYLTVVNDLVARQGAVNFNFSAFIKIVPFWLANYFNSDDNTYFVNSTVNPEFGFNFVSNSSWRSTVSFFNLQLAFALGYKKVVLIGFDHSYVQPKGVTEGVVINQNKDDVNHFDPRYFKGKDWQAADTANMEKMYAVAKAAYDSAGREVVNCTVGGKLETFRRGDLEQELSMMGVYRLPQVDSAFYPKLLMLDSTPVGHASATGQIKQTFLGDWPASSFLQIWETGGKNSSLHSFRLGQSIDQSRAVEIGVSEAIELCRDFQPDVIYFRPVDSESLFAFAEQIAAVIGKPLVIHMMDDWPKRLKTIDNVKFHKLDRALRRLLTLASQRLSICQAMSDVYETRYGGKWFPLANGVDLSECEGKDWLKRQPISQTSPFVIRYMGGLADDMSYSSVRDIAIAVSGLQATIAVRFEIYTMNWYRTKAGQDIGSLPGVSVHPLVGEEIYKQSLTEADALVIAYNFDSHSVSYTSLSLANKMPECLASGAPLIAYGPIEVATILYLKEAECAQTVVNRDQESLVAAILELARDKSLCQRLGEQARAHVARSCSKQLVQQKFKKYLSLSSPLAKPPVDVPGLRPNVGLSFQPGHHFTQAAPNQWHFSDDDAKQKLWIATMMSAGSLSSRTFAGTLRVKADKAITLNISLGRHGNSEYEGTTKRISLTPGVPQTLQLYKQFKLNHKALKLQLDVVELADADSAILTIDQLGLGEVLASIQEWLDPNSLNLFTANRLFRDGDYITALGIYLMLSQHLSLCMYADNAVRSAWRLGMSWVKSTSDLAWLLSADYV